MIPVAPLSLSVLLTLVLGPIALIWLAVWLLLLAFQPRRRERFRQKPWLRLAGLLALLMLGGRYAAFQWAMHGYERDRAAEIASRRHTLAHDARLAGVRMPAGTRLELASWGDPDSVAWARFPQPVRLGQASVVSFERPRPDLADAPWQVRLVQDQHLDGWLCDAGQVVELVADPELEGGFRMASCTLAQGNGLKGWSPLATGTNVAQAPPLAIDLPAGAQVVAVPGGTAYTDGARDADRWSVRVEGDGLRLSLWGMALEWAYFAVDEHKRVLYLAHAQLMQPVELGGISYPPGTQASTPNYRLFPDWPMVVQMRAAEAQDEPAALRKHDLLTGRLLAGAEEPGV